MICARSLRLYPGESPEQLYALAAKSLRVDPGEITHLEMVKQSLDARDKADIHYTCTVAVSLSPKRERQLLRRRGVEAWEAPVYTIPKLTPTPTAPRPVVIGFGPAGMFAALVLAEAGLRPIVFERGSDVDTRQKQVRRFWDGGPLDTQSNVQFGEGGAGLFSDGKLYTGTHDPRSHFVLQQLHRFGAHPSIVYFARPHLGTDVLRDIVRAIRQHIQTLGGQIHTGCCLTDLHAQDGEIHAITVQTPTGPERIACTDLILATGHSARDTLTQLQALGVPLARKGFAMGVRIEHHQAQVDLAQYGRCDPLLPSAEYHISCHTPEGIGVYSFCMCPGGSVIAAASEAEGVVTNGMSLSDRAGENANAAILVGLRPEDFPGEEVLAGMYLQRQIERRAYKIAGGGYLAPAQTLGDFLSGRAGTGDTDIHPSYLPGVTWTDLHSVLPESISTTLSTGLPLLGQKLHCLCDPSAVMTAPETRSSSPVRILRDATGRSPYGFYPCGEGAGYAGGITSAAVDGIRTAEHILNKYLK